MRRTDQGYNYTPLPYQQVWEADFTAFTKPGQYRLGVPGLGVSDPFLIDEGVVSAFTRAFALGLYQQRCGTKLEIPFSRHIHDVCHARPVEVPDISFVAVNNELSQMSSDFRTFQSAPQLKNVDSSLYPFFNRGARDVSGGHHDAGDYSKYTINSAGLIHFLVFAVDAFPGVDALDNLGLPESGDRKSDLLQEAKWEADFLAKMQDDDGGFYFLVYPRDREYENDVLPDKGDPQIVFPKTTAATAAAVAALAEAGSSPALRKQFPTEADGYLAKARLGWTFLQNALAKYGKPGAYQKITHYGNEFAHDDELAWAASAMFAATADQAYYRQLQAWYDPSDPKTRRWSWWRLFEGYGCAARTYAFAARSGRLLLSVLDPLYLSKCESEIQAAADDHVRFARQSAYGTSFPEPNKTYRSAGWFFSSERAFDITVAHQLTPRPEYIEAVLSNLNYEGGCNPVNITYITGLGTRRQREIVHQYSQNDRRVLPPSGLPLGNVQAGFQYLFNYGGDLEGVTFPPHASVTAPYPYYDRWSDSFNTTTEFVVTDQARSLASLAFWMAQTAVANQAWRSATGVIMGLPRQLPAEEKISATLVVPGLDLTQATVVWEARDQEPQFGNPIIFAAKSAGEQWVEVEAQLPDGRRVAVSTNFLATTPLSTRPNSYQSTPLTSSADMVALFHLDSDGADAKGQQGSVTLQGNAAYDSSNLGWMSNRRGAALHFSDLGDRATIEIPASELRSSSEKTAIVLEAMIYVDSFVAYNRQSATILSLYESWDAFLQLGEDTYAGPYVRGGTKMEWKGAGLAEVLTPKVWHHLGIELNQSSYLVRVDGKEVASASSDELSNWGRSLTAKLEFGDFAGWIDEVAVRSIRLGAQPVSITVQEPQDAVNKPILNPSGGSFMNSVTVQLSAATPGATIRYTTDGSAPNGNSPIYGGPLALSSSTRVQAIAFKSGLAESPIATGSYSITATSLSGARATFVRADTRTQGNWRGVYGRQGSSVIGDIPRRPAYVQISTSGKADYSWAELADDVRELQKAEGIGRVAGVWYSSTSFSVSLNLVDGKTHRVGLYFLDWDRGERTQKIEIIDATTGTLLDVQTLSGFGEGNYLVWDLKGKIDVRLTRVSGPNALLSGLFFDPTETSNTLAVAPLLRIPANQLAILLQGFQLHVSGEASQEYVLEMSSNLAAWAPISTNLVANGEVHLVDPSATYPPSRFYRVRSLPAPESQ